MSHKMLVKLQEKSAESAVIRCCPQCGSTMLLWKSERNFECSVCGFMLFLNIAAAVGVIIECRGKILFGVRKHEPQRGMLDLPGGFVDAGETAEQAAQRELHEELGITIQGLSYLCSYPNRYPYRGLVYDTLDFIFVVQLEEAPEFEAADDLQCAIWIDRDAIPYDRIGFSSLRQAVQQYVASGKVV